MVSVTRRWFLASFLTTIVSGILMSGDLAKLGWAQSAESEKEEISGRKIEKMIQEIVQETKRIAREGGISLTDEQLEIMEREIPQTVRTTVANYYTVIDP